MAPNSRPRHSRWFLFTFFLPLLLLLGTALLQPFPGGFLLTAVAGQAGHDANRMLLITGIVALLCAAYAGYYLGSIRAPESIIGRLFIGVVVFVLQTLFYAAVFFAGCTCTMLQKPAQHSGRENLPAKFIALPHPRAHGYAGSPSTAGRLVAGA